MCAVGDLSEVISGPAFKSAEFGGDGEGTRLLRGDNIEPGSLRWTNARTWPDHLLDGYEHLLLREGDVIVAMDRPIVSSGLKVARVRSADLPALLVQRVARIRPASHVLSKVLFFVMLHDRFRSHLQEGQTGTQLPHITLNRIRIFEVPLPPAREQHLIVSALEEAFSKLDAGEAGLRGVRQRLRRMRDVVLEMAVSGRLVPQQAGDTPAVDVLDDLGVAPIADGEPFKVPPNWAWAVLGDVAAVGGGIQKQPKRVPDVNPVPFLRVANVGRGQLDLGDIHQIELFEGELERYGLRDGDLLVVEGNGSPTQIGRAAMWQAQVDPCVHQNHLIRVRPLSPLLPAYLELYWNSPGAARRVQAVASSTSGLHTLSTGKLKAIPVAVPPIEEQQRIVAEVERQLVFIETAERAVGDGLARSVALRRSILRAAFEGQLVSQDPTDEPASLLLGRIHAERETVQTTPIRRRMTKAAVSQPASPPA